MISCRFVILYLLLLICCVNPMKGQSLIFTTDTAILTSCEKRTPQDPTHYIINTTDHDITLRWKRTHYQVPEETDFLMIFDGLQYFPFVSAGVIHLYPYDSTEIIFTFWHDTILPGDSVVLQIIVYDEEDSLHTVHHQTFIQHCPLQTGISDPASEIEIEVFPNPVFDEATIKIAGHIEAPSLILYTLTGDCIRRWPLTRHEITLPRDDIPGGLYFMGIESQGRVLAVRKIMFVE